MNDLQKNPTNIKRSVFDLNNTFITDFRSMIISWFVTHLFRPINLHYTLYKAFIVQTNLLKFVFGLYCNIWFYNTTKSWLLDSNTLYLEFSFYIHSPFGVWHSVTGLYSSQGSIFNFWKNRWISDRNWNQNKQAYNI